MNPDAKDDKSSPLHGMHAELPPLDGAGLYFVMRRGRGTGLSGVENPLFTRDNTRMICTGAKGVLGSLV